MDVSIVIVNYNTRALLEQCLTSVFKQTMDVNFEVIVVDNNSQDDSLEMLSVKFSQVTVVSSDQNVGFGRANNLGIAVAKGKYVFMLNSDTLLGNNAVKLFFDFMERPLNKDVGAVGAVMLDCNNQLNYGNSFNRFFTFRTFIEDTLLSIIGYKRKYVKSRLLLEKEKQLSVDFIVGADLFCSKQVLDQIGGFDPRFFLYYEETDMQLRMKSLNLKRLIIQGPEIVHFEGGSSSKSMTYEKYKVYAESMFRYFRKNRPCGELFLLKLYVLFVSFIGFFKNLLLFRPNYRKLSETYWMVKNA